MASLINFIKDKRCGLIALSFTLLGLYLRFKKLAGRELWTDEFCQIKETLGPFKPVWQRLNLIDFTTFPGPYLINYPFVNFLGTGKWVINIPNYIFTVLGFYFLYLLCRRHLKTWVGYFIAYLLFCLNGNLIFYAFEFRPYSALPTMSLGCFYFAEIIIMEWQKISRSKKILIWLFFIFVITYHVFGFMMAGLSFAYFLIIRARETSYGKALKESAPFLLSMGLPGLLLFIWYTSGTVWEVVEKGNWYPFDFYPNPVTDFNHFCRQVLANLRGNKTYGQKYLELGIWFSFLWGGKDRFKLMGFFLLMVLLPIFVLVAAALYVKYWFLDRQFIWVMSLYAFFLGWCWDKIYIYLKEKVRKRLKLVTVK